ncbi:hypothetical protein ACSQ67_024761 [Phaseolus vulgaris]
MSILLGGGKERRCGEKKWEGRSQEWFIRGWVSSSANQKISDACALIQNYVAKLVEEVGISSFSNSGPKPIEAHFGESCQQAHGVNNGDCGAGEGVAAGRVRNMEVSGNQPAACENKEFAFSAIVCNTINNNFDMVEGICKVGQKENKEAFAGGGEEAERQGIEEAFGMADLQRKRTSRTLVRRKRP